MHNRIAIVNAGTIHASGGSPTAVYLSNKAVDAATMQVMAQELYVPVTAFVWPLPHGYAIRYFTALTEIPSCGHATLAAALVMNVAGGIGNVHFQTGEGVAIESFVQGGMVRTGYAIAAYKNTTADAVLLRHLGVETYKAILWAESLRTLFIELKDAGEVQKLAPDFSGLLSLSTPVQEVVVMAPSDDGYADFVLRSFCPWIGIDEDPVTGSVQAVLGPYWRQKLNKEKLIARQLSKRGGALFLQIEEDKVWVSGHCALVSNGGICLGA